MSARSFTVVYLDRRAREEGIYTQDCPPRKPAVADRNASASAYGILGSADEVDDNITTLLRTYEKVAVVKTSLACYVRMNEAQPELDRGSQKYLVIMDIPYSEGYYYYTPPGAGEAQTVAENLYGMQYFNHLVYSIRAHRLGGVIIPVVLLSKPSTLPAESLFVSKDRFPGAADILVSPLSSEAMATKLQTLPEKALAAAVEAGAKRFATLMQGPVSRLMMDICDPDIIGEFNQSPDLPILTSRREAVASAVGTWNFSAHSFTDDELLYGALLMFQHVLKDDSLAQWRMSNEDFMKFLLVVREAYNTSVIYHNFRHACDVLQACFYFCISTGIIPPFGTQEFDARRTPSGLGSIMKPFNALVLLISAMGHDVGHPGVNNMFLVRVKATVAQLYNDHSVLESFHCALYSQLLRRFWPSVGNDSAIRKLMISSILATDMTLHGQYTKQLDVFRDFWDENDRSITSWDESTLDSNRELLSCLIIKCGDICNVARDFDIAKEWANLVTDEFANQGRMELDANIPTCLFGGPPPAGDLKDMAERQLGFMNIFAGGLFERMTNILPGMAFTTHHVNRNKKIWQQVLDEELSKTSNGDAKSSTPKPFLDGNHDEDMIDIPPEASPDEPRIGLPQVIHPQIPSDPNTSSRRSSIQAMSGERRGSGQERRGSGQSGYKLSSTRTPSPRRGSIATSSHFQSLAQSSRDTRRSSLGPTVNVS